MIARPVLEIADLTVGYAHQGEILPAVRDFSLVLHAGETYGLVGESGSGKSTVALAVMRYLGQNGRVVSGSIHFNGRDLLTLTDQELRDVWGKEIAYVPQDPQSSLNPSIRIGEQIAEILRRHESLDREGAYVRAEELLDLVRVPDPPRVANSYPHQISGGMQQRALIAMALSTDPQLLVLDEPTTGLDVTTQAAVLDLFRDLARGSMAAVLYVTHNLGVVAELCDRVAVLYAGDLVEDASAEELFSKPLHPYTEGLLDSVPQIGQNKSEVALKAIPGQIPPLGERPAACVFAPRCVLAVERCREERPVLEAAKSSQFVACHRWPEIAAGEVTARTEPELASSRAALPGASLLDLEDVEVYYSAGRTLSDVLHRRPSGTVKAVDGVSLDVGRGRTIGIVGESGSGKTSLARAIIGLVERTGGEISLLDFVLPAGLSARGIDTLRQLQYVFQNPDEALNPHLTVGQTLRRPYMSLQGDSRDTADAKVLDLLAMVRLPASYADRLPAQLSGGEKQRVAIARAFAADPELLIADEPVSALDVSVQASILNLLRDLQMQNQTALVLISHDLTVVGYLADEIAVMYLGQIMEVAPAAELFLKPMHPYTEALVAAIPVLDPAANADRVLLEGDLPSQMEAQLGCPFHTRCPRLVGDICRTDRPPWQKAASGDLISCHIPLTDLAQLQSANNIQREQPPTKLG